MKKTMSVLLALVLMLALSVPAMAIPGGTITINNAVVGQSYTLYEILYLESYNAGSGAYAYKATTDWADFINSNAIKGVYVNVDDQGYVTWVKDADAAAFAKLAQAYATEHSIDNQGTTEATTATVTFNDLELGYYLVDSTLGTLCSLDTTNPTVTIKEKNAEPTNVKTVEEDSTGAYGATNDADIGQTVNFKSTITAQAGAENYVFHDKMSAGLTYTGVTGVTLNGAAVAAKNYTVKTEGLTDDCTFEVVFTQAFCDTLKVDNTIVISYTATVNENAVIGTEGNPNESRLSYGDSSNTKTTPGSTTTTYTWKIDVLKYTEKDGKEEKLSGAKFTLSKSSDGSNPIALISEGNNTYRVAKDGEDGTVTEIMTDDTGAFIINGLDSDTYYLTETAAPAGYNRLAGPVKVVIGNDGTVTYNETSTGTIKVLNNTGAELPSTGGIGTTVFYVAGGLMVLAAIVLLATKKKMSAHKD